MDLIKDTLEYVKKELCKSPYYQKFPHQLDYRIEHTVRVTNIGMEIARKSGMDVEMAALACLLHDISYSYDFKNPEDIKNHGRSSARFATTYLKKLGYPEEKIEKIAFSIAIHVDNRSDTPGVYDEFAYLVRDADNIDRFDVFRIYENLSNEEFHLKPLGEKLEIIERIMSLAKRLKEVSFATEFSNRLWQERTEYYINFFKKLKKQMEMSQKIEVYKV